MSKNIFKKSEIANKFDLYNDVLEQTLGYDFVLQKFAENDTKRILDYGCGPGKVSARLADGFSGEVIAVDESDKMIELAKAERKRKNIHYDVVKNNNLGFLDDNSVDGALTCYVFINIGNEGEILEIMKEIYRVLKKNSRFVILDTNPNTTGIKFSTFTNGVKNKQYGYGERRREWLHIKGKDDLILDDFNWPNEMYEKNLKLANFSDISVEYHSLADLGDADLKTFSAKYGSNIWGAEKTVAPFILYVAYKR